LGFVADFSEGDNPGRDEDRFHKYSQAGPKTIDHDASPAKNGGVVVKDLAKLGNRLRHDLLVKCVDVSLFAMKRGYSPMTHAFYQQTFFESRSPPLQELPTTTDRL